MESTQVHSFYTRQLLFTNIHLSSSINMSHFILKVFITFVFTPWLLSLLHSSGEVTPATHRSAVFEVREVSSAHAKLRGDRV